MKGFNRRILIFLVFFLLVAYLISYVVNTSLGGYYMVPERDGKNRLFFENGFSMSDTILWQPNMGYYAPFKSDIIGVLYSPLIHLDREYWHTTLYITNPDDEKVIMNLDVEHMHPDTQQISHLPPN